MIRYLFEYNICWQSVQVYISFKYLYVIYSKLFIIIIYIYV